MCIALLGTVMDIFLAFLAIAQNGFVEGIQTEIILGLHLACSLILLKITLW
jgi:hypothetical protein